MVGLWPWVLVGLVGGDIEWVSIVFEETPFNRCSLPVCNLSEGLTSLSRRVLAELWPFGACCCQFLA